MAACLVAAALTFAAHSAQAQVVNPGELELRMSSGMMKIGTTQVFKIGASSLVGMTISGNVDSANNFVAPREAITSGTGFVIPFDDPDDNIDVALVPTEGITGTVNPVTGTIALSAKLKIRLSGGVLNSATCFIGTDSNPLQLNGVSELSTSSAGSAFDTSSVPNPAFAGTAFNSSQGTFTLASNDFAAPAALETPECENIVKGFNRDTDGFGLPAPAGSNAIALRGSTSKEVVGIPDPIRNGPPGGGTGGGFGTGVDPQGASAATASAITRVVAKPLRTTRKAKSSFSVTVACRSSQPTTKVTCRGTSTVVAKARYRVKIHKGGKTVRRTITKSIKLGAKTIAVDSGKAQSFKIVLSKKAKLLLRRSRRMRGTATTRLAGSAKPAASTASFTLKAKRGK